MERLAEPAKYQPECGRPADKSIAFGDALAQQRMGPPEHADVHRDVAAAKDAPAQANNTLGEFQKKHGVEVSEKDGRYEFKLSGSSKIDVLFQTEASDKGLDEARRKLKELVEAKIASIKKDFRVTFSREGEDVVKQWVRKDDCSYEQGKMIKARDPMLKELVGIEAALERSQPSNVAPDGKGAKIHFLTAKKSDDAQAAYHLREGGRSQVYFDPGMTEEKPILEADSEALKRNIQYSIEAITVHEFAHSAQRNMDWDVQARQDKFAAETGWVPYEDTKTHEHSFLLKGKNGEFFKRGRDHCTDITVWALADSSGNLLGVDGKPVEKFKDAKIETADHVRQNAVVKPPTEYFSNPLEMYAEGLMLFRLGPTYRESLLKQSPEMYESVKKFDQDEINKVYGVTNGVPKYIRNPRGYIVHNTQDNRKLVDDFEAAKAH